MSPGKPRIGVLLTSGKAEAEKEDLIDIQRRSPARPWLKPGVAVAKPIKRPKQKKGFMTRKKLPAMSGYPADVSIAEYVRFHHGKHFDIDYIHPGDLSAARLKSNDINYLITYDLLEAYHIGRKARYQEMKKALEKSTNVFPNFQYQELINSKIKYYGYLAEKGIPILPTITITREEWFARIAQITRERGARGAAAAATLEVLEEVQARGFQEGFVAKPEYGQESKDVTKFAIRKSELKTLEGHLGWIFDNRPGLIIQELVKDFYTGKNCPELRMYFVGKKYQCCMFFTKKGMKTLAEEGGFDRVPPGVDLDAVKALALRTVNCLPAVTLERNAKSVDLPKLLTRVDIGCFRNGVFDPWVNEVEFVPSMFVELNRYPIDARVGEQMAKIAKQFVNSNRSPSQKSREKKPTKSKKRAGSLVSESPLSVQKWKRSRRTGSGGKVINHKLKKTKRSTRS